MQCSFMEFLLYPLIDIKTPVVEFETDYIYFIVLLQRQPYFFCKPGVGSEVEGGEEKKVLRVDSLIY